MLPPAPLATGDTADVVVVDVVVEAVVVVVVPVAAFGVCAAPAVTGMTTFGMPFSRLAAGGVPWPAPLSASKASAAW